MLGLIRMGGYTGPVSCDNRVIIRWEDAKNVEMICHYGIHVMVHTSSILKRKS